MDSLSHDLSPKTTWQTVVVDAALQEADGAVYGLVNSVAISFFVPCYNEEDNVVIPAPVT